MIRTTLLQIDLQLKAPESKRLLAILPTLGPDDDHLRLGVIMRLVSHLKSQPMKDCEV